VSVSSLSASAAATRRGTVACARRVDFPVAVVWVGRVVVPGFDQVLVEPGSSTSAVDEGREHQTQSLVLTAGESGECLFLEHTFVRLEDVARLRLGSASK
jgi:hypothetical protein